MRKSSLATFAAMLALAALGLTAGADPARGDIIDVVNVDLQGYRGSEAAPTTYSGTSPVGSGTFWNGVTVPNVGPNGGGYSDGTNSTSTGDQQSIPATTPLLDQNSVLSPITFSIGPVGVDNPMTVGNALMNDYVFNDSAGNMGLGANFTISGVPADTSVALYFYNGSQMPGLTVDGGTLQTFSPTGIFTTGNTLEYTLTTNALGSPITGSFSASTTNVFAGFSVSYAVPEPATAPLLALGLAGVLAAAGRRRRRQAKNSG